MAEAETKPIHVYVGLIIVAGLIVFAANVIPGGQMQTTLASLATFWFMTACVVGGELCPISMPRRGEVEEITTSTAFSFGLLIIAGPAAAIVAQAIASLTADVIGRKPLWKAGFNVGQYTLSLGMTGWTLGALSDVPHPQAPHFDAVDLFAIIAAGIVFFLVNRGLVQVALAIASGQSIGEKLNENFGFNASTTGVMLGLGPIVVMAAERSVMLELLVVLPIAAVYQSARISVENTSLADILRQQADQNEYQALHDTLTGLPNRALFHDRVQHAITAARREDTAAALMIMDLDRFKEINDALGHHNGDLLLQQLGSRLQTCLRESDTIARLGGDEFAVLLPKLAHPAAATRAAEKIQAALEQPFIIQGLALNVGASIGISFFPEHGKDADTLIQRADVAMYVAKAAHSGYELYSTEQDQYSPRRLALVGELRRAIDNDELVLHFQPKADLQNGGICGTEALLRWQHPRYGLVPPDDFVPLAEHTGLIRPLTLYVLDAALRQCSSWHRSGLEIGVAVNLSAQNLLDLELPDEVAGLLTKWGVSPAWLELEITESSIMADPVRAMGVLTRLHEMGVGLAIDDFGTGYSSLAYLKRLPVNEIKIDKSFVMGMMTDDNDAVIVQSTIDLGRNLGLRVVAEGVETEEVWRTLAALGCNVAQGYFLSRPVAPEELTPWLLEELRTARTDDLQVTTQPIGG